MTKAELMELVGKKVTVYFNHKESGIYGTLGYADEFSAKHDYRKTDYFYIGNTSFKVSHVKKVKVMEWQEKKSRTRPKLLTVCLTNVC